MWRTHQKFSSNTPHAAPPPQAFFLPSFLPFFPSLFCRAHGIWKFPGQGLNLSCNTHHSCGNTRSLTHSSTEGTPQMSFQKGKRQLPQILLPTDIQLNITRFWRQEAGPSGLSWRLLTPPHPRLTSWGRDKHEAEPRAWWFPMSVSGQGSRGTGSGGSRFHRLQGGRVESEFKRAAFSPVVILTSGL